MRWLPLQDSRASSQVTWQLPRIPRLPHQSPGVGPPKEHGLPGSSRFQCRAPIGFRMHVQLCPTQVSRKFFQGQASQGETQCAQKPWQFHQVNLLPGLIGKQTLESQSRFGLLPLKKSSPQWHLSGFPSTRNTASPWFDRLVASCSLKPSQCRQVAGLLVNLDPSSPNARS